MLFNNEWNLYVILTVQSSETNRLSNFKSRWTILQCCSQLRPVATSWTKSTLFAIDVTSDKHFLRSPLFKV
jgi:hypothetical protein